MAAGTAGAVKGSTVRRCSRISNRWRWQYIRNGSDLTLRQVAENAHIAYIIVNSGLDISRSPARFCGYIQRLVAAGTVVMIQGSPIIGSGRGNPQAVIGFNICNPVLQGILFRLGDHGRIKGVVIRHIFLRQCNNGLLFSQNSKDKILQDQRSCYIRVCGQSIGNGLELHRIQQISHSVQHGVEDLEVDRIIQFVQPGSTGDLQVGVNCHGGLQKFKILLRYPGCHVGQANHGIRVKIRGGQTRQAGIMQCSNELFRCNAICQQCGQGRNNQWVLVSSGDHTLQHSLVWGTAVQPFICIFQFNHRTGC